MHTETPQGFLIDDIWIASNLSSDAILGQSSLAAFKNLTLNYGGNLPSLSIEEISTKSNQLTQSTLQSHALSIFNLLNQFKHHLVANQMQTGISLIKKLQSY